jgi:integrase
MGRIVKRGTKQRPRFYLKYRDADGVERTRAAKGAYTPAQARVMLAEIERRIMNGKIGIIEPTKEEREQRTITVRQLGAKFVTEYSTPKIKNLDEYRDQARCKFEVRINPRLGDKPAASVRLIDVERLRDDLLRGVQDSGAGLAPDSVRLTLAALSKAYSWGRKAGHIDCANPVQGCERPSPVEAIDYLSRDEVIALLRHAAEHAPTIHPMIATAIYTGMRKGELLGLRWRDVHFDAGRIDVLRSYNTTPKSGKKRHVPLGPELSRILRQWEERCPKTDAGLAFPVLDGETLRMGCDNDMLGIKQLMRGAGCHVLGKPWHDLRHTYASHFVMAGGSILALKEILGHADIKTTMRYAHLGPDYLKAEAARVSFVPAQPAGVASLDDERRRRVLALLEARPEELDRLLGLAS